jgi:hypothetical protein
MAIGFEALFPRHSDGGKVFLFMTKRISKPEEKAAISATLARLQRKLQEMQAEASRRKAVAQSHPLSETQVVKKWDITTAGGTRRTNMTAEKESRSSRLYSQPQD